MSRKYRIYILYFMLFLCPLFLAYFSIKNVGILVTSTILIVFYFIVIMLSYMIRQNIILPIRKLRDTASEICNGNLDVTIEEEGNDVTKELFDDFEEIKNRLKKLLENHKLYEEESKALIGNISHDLKTPLTAIKGYAEGIIDGVPSTPEKMEKYVKTIYTKANDMTKLIDELYLYTRIDEDEKTYHFMPINLHDFFSDCISELTLDLEVKNISLVYFNYSDIRELVLADAEQLKRVIKNIIGNSVKYIGHKKGIINVRILDAKEELQIQIEDNGIGIHKNELPYIFDRFYRADASRNMTDGGSGLGLAIVKKIVEEHGCRVWADGDYGMGVSIYFTLKKYTMKEEGKNGPNLNC